MNRSTFTQSGELVTISRLKIKEKWKFLRSLRFRITVILVIIGIVPCVILEKSIVNSYEDRAVSVRSITVKNQCDIICNQLIQQNYMEDPGSDVINGQLSMLTNIYGGRILIIDQDFRVIKDTYDMDRGKTIISQEVIQSFQGKETSQYDRKNNYLEMTVRIQNTETKETLGVMLVSISTDEIRANMKILETKGMTILSIIALLVLVFGYLLAGILMKPFQKVTRSIEDITDGYLDESISVPDYLETELITDAFNKSFMWLFRSGEDGLAEIILYGYSPTRSGSHAKEFPEGYSGYLETDGYQGYNSLPGIRRCSCWAHIRRYFIDAVPKGKQYDYSQPSVQGVQYCNRLFAMEDSINKKYPGNYEKRKQLRLEKEKPVLEAFWSWLDQQKPVRNTRLDKAVNYVLNRRDIAETYLEDGRCSFTNNLSENAIRPFAVGRKNWLFSSSVDGANASAVVYTMVEMAKAHGLNIYGYLKFLLENRPSKNMTDEQLAELAPWSEKLQSIKNRM